ncbi:nitroreductase family protein [Ruegeria marina]|uniref:Nitroreductase n=1 Tax=Ruegeria marina TaxID=639004 RepID=A0A1G6QQR2_9RHOB|nr:nitroreductase family protein [Ruegeria marina]SDC94035.1 nitroreductase [Ruegeria marina]
MGDETSSSRLAAVIEARFGDRIDMTALDLAPAAADAAYAMLSRGSCRHYADRPVPEAMMRLLGAIALSSPSKSDLQQRDIIWVRGPQASRVKALAGAQDWIAGAPELLVFCANNRRQRQLHQMQGRPFANDHLDAFFNASVDAAIALSACVSGAEALGLGCCPISTIRNAADEVSAVLGLPGHVFPVAALAVGWPEFPQPRLSMRLPLAATFHENCYSEGEPEATIAEYDQRRAGQTRGMRQRAQERFGRADPYTWSDDKTRQYAVPERADFAEFIRVKGFRIDPDTRDE